MARLVTVGASVAVAAFGLAFAVGRATDGEAPRIAEISPADRRDGATLSAPPRVPPLPDLRKGSTTGDTPDDPPTGDPPIGDPRTVDPPNVDPPTIDPPIVDPPVVDPPVVDPPVVDPPIERPPEDAVGPG